MKSNEQQWRLWPALEGLSRGRRWRLRCEQGNWSGSKEAEGSGWVATSAGFDASARQRAEVLYLGDEDDPQEALIWHGTDDAHLAVLCRPDRGRNGSAARLQRRVLEFGNPRRLPAALLAFAMLPQVRELADSDRNPESYDIFVDEFALMERIETGCHELARALKPEALTKVYAHLLAGQHYVVLPEPEIPLTPAAFSALLLPLSRDLADRFSMLSRLPSRNIDKARLTEADDRATVRWHLLGLGNCLPDRLPSPVQVPDAETQELAAALVRAVTNNDPTMVSAQPSGRSIPPPASEQTTAPSSIGPTVSADRQFRIWGASSSGKTVYLAYLLLKHRHGGDPRWRISPPAGADTSNLLMRIEEHLQQNRFPEPTGSGQQFDYRLTDEQTGRQATISMEDRPGAEFEAFDGDTARRLSAADGLMLLLDPNRDRGRQDAEVVRAFTLMQEIRAEDKDPRRLAVCVSKSDELIHSVEEYRRALEAPEEFLANSIGQTISNAIHHHFETYRIFALSAVGLRILHGAVEPGVFYDERLEPHPNVLAQPINLIDPLVWLLGDNEQ
ncbi:MAG: hypothetical protein LGR52_00990 [Candidatus Thiosymbion ectosymbiont of Robbea hypermnestra]|nr:hypothetical protein [Candidatus Thiosymbion ectosymbiont of Robbea hypermnestra]